MNITKDIISFANTKGGYLVFGIEDRTFNKIGINEKDYKILIDPDDIQKKINAYILPPIISMITAYKLIDAMRFIIIHIPESKGKTHIVVKEGKFKNKGEKEIIILRKGEIFVRRSGSTILIEPTDLDDIIDRRLKYYKESLLENIVKVIETPPEKEILIFEPSANEITFEGKRFVLSSDKDAIPVKGIPTTITPKNDESEIITSIALFRKDKTHLPGTGLLYRIYANRKDIKLSGSYYKDLALISIYKEVPCFYWLQFLPRKDIEEVLDEIFKRGNYFMKSFALKISACLGKPYFSKCIKKANDSRNDWLITKFNQSGCDGLFFSTKLGSVSSEEIDKEATSMAKELSSEKDSADLNSLFVNETLAFVDYKLYSINIAKLLNKIDSW